MQALSSESEMLIDNDITCHTRLAILQTVIKIFERLKVLKQCSKEN